MTQVIQHASRHPRQQTQYESIAWKIDLGKLNTDLASPTNGVVQSLVDVTDNNNNVKPTVMPVGNPVISSQVMTLPVLKSLTPGRLYQMIVSFDDSGNTLTFIERVKCIG